MSKESDYPSNPHWTTIRPLRGSVNTLTTGVHPVADREDIAIAVYGPAAMCVIERYCPHQGRDLTLFGMVNATTCQLSCVHRRYDWGLPEGTARLGRDVRVLPSVFLEGELWIRTTEQDVA